MDPTRKGATTETNPQAGVPGEVEAVATTKPGGGEEAEEAAETIEEDPTTEEEEATVEGRAMVATRNREKANKFHQNEIAEKEKQIKQNILLRDGFLADPSLPTSMNVTQYYRSLDWETITTNARMTHALHNLCSSNIILPPGTSRLLSLGLNFCIKTPYPNINIKAVIDQFTKDVRNLNFWRNKADDGEERKYIPELHVKNEEWNPPRASAEIEAAIKRFARALRQEHKAYNHQWSRPNITQQQRHLLMYLKNHPILIILASDKNLGPVIMERTVYIQRCLDDFLAKPEQYDRLTKQQVGATSRKISYAYQRFHGSTHSASICPEIQAFFHRTEEKYGDNIARFRASPKVHKSPWNLQPVIAKCGTTIEGLCKWLDYELQKLRPYIPSYIKNSYEYHKKITSRKWPAGTLLFTADATAMYDNIDIDHGIKSVKLWLD